jgi:hypothetical protein
MTFSSGALSGMPTVTGSFPMVITATDSKGNQASEYVTLVVAMPCDIQQNGSITVGDERIIIHEALGVIPAVHDLSGDGRVSVVDVEIETNAVLGLGCEAK